MTWEPLPASRQSSFAQVAVRPLRTANGVRNRPAGILRAQHLILKCCPLSSTPVAVFRPKVAD